MHLQTSARPLVLVVLAFTTTLALAARSGLAVQTPLAELTGIVVDDSEVPVVDATVCLVGAESYARPVMRTRGRILTKTDSSGKFTLSLLPQDLPILASHSPNVTLVVAAEQHSLHVDRFPATRMQSNAPMKVVLKADDSCSLSIRDSTGKPAQAVEIMPAEVDGKKFAYRELDFLSATTDALGSVQLQHVSNKRVSAVYVSSRELGKQLLRTTLSKADAGGGKPRLTAQAIAITKQSIAFTFPRDIPPEERPDLSALRATFISNVEEQGVEFVWDEVAAHPEGEFPSVLVARGNTSVRLDVPDDFAFLISRDPVQVNGEFKTLEFVAADLVTCRAIDSNTADGIPGLIAQTFSPTWRYSFTDAQGRLAYWTHGISDGFYVSDPLGRYMSPRAFYRKPQGLPDENRIIRVPAESMIPMSGAQGIVLDSKGQPAGGVAIEVTYQKERFTNQVRLFSDTDGRFAFHHIPEGANVQLSASSPDQRTTSPVEFNAETGQQIQLQMSKVFPQSFSAKLTDTTGKPIAGATIVLKKSSVVVEENFSAEDRTESPLFSVASLIETDADGVFESPTTASELSQVAFEASAPGYRQFHSQWFQLDTPQSERTVKLKSEGASFKLQSVATPQQVAVTIASSEGQELSGVQFLSFGPHTGLIRESDCSSSFSVVLKNGKQVIAARAEGYAPKFVLVDELPDKVHIALHPSDGDPMDAQVDLLGHEAAHRESPQVDRLDLAKRLLAKVKSDGGADSFHRMILRTKIELFTDPTGLADRIKREKNWQMMPWPSSSPAGKEFAYSVLEELDDPKVRPALIIELAKLEDDIKVQRRLIDEILANVEGLGGVDQATMGARAACLLVSAGQHEQAKQLIRDIWDNQDGLKDLVSRGIRVGGAAPYRGLARYFAPELAMVQRRTALKLIELCGDANEIPWLQTQAVCFLANSGDSSWKIAVRTFLDGKLHGIGLRDFLSKTRFSNIEQGRQLVPFLDSTLAKADLLMHLAQQPEVADDAQRIELLEQAHQCILDSNMTPGVTHPAWLAADISDRCQDLAPALAKQGLFTAFWKCEGTHSILPFDTLAGIVSRVGEGEPMLARHLTEACVDDWSWLYNVRNSGLMFESNRPLEMAALVDPAWATGLAIELMENHFEYDTSRQLATVSSVIGVWAEQKANSRKRQ